MRIGIDARYIYDHFPGIGRYCYHLIRALNELEHEHTLILLTHPGLPNTRYDLYALSQDERVQTHPTTVWPFSLAEHWHIPRLARSLRLDVLHSPYYIKPYVGLSCPSVVTIYDLIGQRLPEMLSWHSRYLFNLLNGLAARRASRVLTISQSTRDDVLHFYHIPPERVVVTPLAADQCFRPQSAETIAALHATYGLPDRYMLYLGANKPHKNLVRLLEAWEGVNLSAYPGMVLVIAGHYDPRYPEARVLVEQRGLAGRVMFVPHVQEQDLPALYSGAYGFVFPSIYEGFGLPPLEAMACGTPVLCARASSLPEVVGEAARLFDPYCIEELRGTLQQLLDTPALREHLHERGLERARCFSWRQTALGTLAVYEEVGSRVFAMSGL